MHLINVHTLTLREFAGSRDLPPYAILSHTWGPEEISFAEFSDPGRPYLAHDGAGLRKIRLTCQKARAAGLDWAWIDTCCIDKSSSAELSEAINSMFKWYRGARVCFAILGKCRWFSRGWTLQELIAPRHVKFYIDELAKKGCHKNKNVDRRWISIGSKKDLVGALSIVTRIDSPILLSEQSLDSISVAGRMSWAAGRQTSREEDIAYCLMGIFGVNMPMLYGEGSKAFQRLQEEIMRESDDHSLFVWRAKPESARRFPYRGLLADSPDEFVYSEGIEPIPLSTIDERMS
ncbi:heterokaryon incompatibility protein-domain-containing protein [Camillea tinctor]|nr:heterokaryon incompatibility protein-domain-containing protein [Camillea tinctor]